MRAIFTYPDNSGTYYIDPDYVGDATVGFYKRVDELRDGTYKAWNNPTARASTEAILAGLGKYWKMYDNFTGAPAPTFYDFWTYPLIEGTMREKGFRYNAFVTSEVGGEVYILLSSNIDTFQYPTGEFVTFRENIAFSGLNNTSAYAERNTATTITLYDDAAMTTPREYAGINDKLNPTAFYAKDWAQESYYNGSEMRLGSSYSYTIPNGTAVRFTTTIANANPYDANNVANQADTDFFVKLIGTNRYALYTDYTLTTPASLEDVYLGGGEQTQSLVNSDPTDNLRTGADVSSWGSSIKTELQNNPSGWCRYWVTGDIDEAPYPYYSVPTARSAETPMFYIYDSVNEQLSMFDDISGNELYYISLSGGTAVSHFEFIAPMNLSINGGFAWRRYDYQSVSGLAIKSTDLQADDTTPFWELDTVNMMLPGNRTYMYRTGASTYVPGIKFNNEWYLEGDSLATAKTGEESMPAGSIVTLDSSGYITGFTIGSENSDDLGRFADGDTRLFTFSKLADTYTPPALSPAELEDVWDTADEWTNASYNASKEWPTVVAPRKVAVNLLQPSSVTIGQSGIKYVRNADYSKLSLDVEYPPMTREQFEPFFGIANAARGQTIPFYFNLVYGGNYILFGPARPYTGNLRIKEPAAVGARVLTIEGFDSNYSTAIAQGEMLEIEGRNGYLNVAISETDSNIYGEAKFRLAYPIITNLATGYRIIKRPTHAVVTFNSNDFNYTQDVDGYYRLSVTLYLDEWK